MRPLQAPRNEQAAMTSTRQVPVDLEARLHISLPADKVCRACRVYDKKYNEDTINELLDSLGDGDEDFRVANMLNDRVVIEVTYNRESNDSLDFETSAQVGGSEMNDLLDLFYLRWSDVTFVPVATIRRDD
jgi:hypothetical protein